MFSQDARCSATEFNLCGSSAQAAVLKAIREGKTNVDLNLPINPDGGDDGNGGGTNGGGSGTTGGGSDSGTTGVGGSGSTGENTGNPGTSGGNTGETGGDSGSVSI